LNVPQLAAGDVQLWAITLDPDGAHVDCLAQLLSKSERERAGRFLFSRDQRHYILRHGFLRWLLGQHLACAPKTIHFATGPHGKPRLAGDPALHFNLSQSGGMALIGLSRESELGVDIESTLLNRNEDAIVHKVFTRREAAAYFHVPVSQRPVVFFNCWTRKEAVVKARGVGMSVSFKGIDVSVLPGESARLIAMDGDSACVDEWTLMHLEPLPGFIGALAIQQTTPKVSARLVDLGRPERLTSDRKCFVCRGETRLRG